MISTVSVLCSKPNYTVLLVVPFLGYSVAVSQQECFDLHRPHPLPLPRGHS